MMRLYSRNPCFVRARRTTLGRESIRKKLAQAPWLWPHPERHPIEWDAARAVNAGPGMLRHGEVALVTVKDGKGSLWRFEVSDREGDILIGPEGRRAWRDAVTTLPRTLPFLWKSMNQYMNWELHARALESDGSKIITGPSLGLALGLALASHILERALPGDFIASATCDEYGTLGRVDGLRGKLSIVAEAAPGIARVFVAKEQASEAEALCEELGLEHIEVLGVSHLHEALEHLLEQTSGLEQMPWISGDESESERIERIDSLFRLAVGERNAAIAWGPVARAAQEARRVWADKLEIWQREKLDFAAAVATRHHTNSGTLSMPQPSWLARLPRPTRIRVIAHIVQQAADTNTPPANALFELAQRYLPEGGVLDAFDPQIQLMGSIGRLAWTAKGDLDKAIEYQRDAANAWWQRWKHEEMSYPISALYTLCAIKASRSPDLLDASNNLYSKIEHLEQLMEQGGERCRDNPYVLLAKARADLSLGRTLSSKKALEALLERERIPDTLRGSALRWVLVNDLVFKHEVEYRRHRLKLDALDARGTVAIDICLLELTEAAREEDPERCQSALATYADLQPGLDAMLRGHADAPREDDFVSMGRFIIARHPY